MVFRRVSPAVLLAVGIGGGALALNFALARQLREIDRDARTIASTWIGRSAAIATLEDGVREFRRREALRALSLSDADRRRAARQLDSLRAVNDSAVSMLAGLDASRADSAATRLLTERWHAYTALSQSDTLLSTGDKSPAMQQFRLREPVFQGLLSEARRVQDTLRTGARGVALRSQRSVRASWGLLLGRLLLVLAVIALAEIIRRNWRRLSAAEQRWRDVADQSVGVVWELGPTGRVRFCSQSGAELLGVRTRDIEHRRALHFVHRDDRRRALEVAAASMAEHAPLRDLEVRVQRADGTVRWLAVSAQALRTSSGTHDGFRGLAVDITRRAQAEQALEQRRRLEAVGTLAGGVAHDLNNVLAAVNGYAQLIQAELPANSPLQEDLGAITSAADRGAQLVRRVLQFARQRTSERQPVEMAECIQEVVQLLRQQVPAHVRVVLTLPDGDAMVLADATEMHQLVVNIASNALHAMQETGSSLHITLAAQPASVVLTISDDGAGMSPDVLARAIDPFFTTRDIGVGTGLGLAVAHGVVTALGGTLVLESQVGSGTTVRVTLPRLHAIDIEPAAPMPALTAAQSPAPLRVMLVDDDPQVRRSLTRLLERDGHTVDSYAEAPAALAVLVDKREQTDVIMTDLMMPGMNGLEFLGAVQALSDAPPVIMCSGYLDGSTTARARALGVACLLDKPVQPAALHAALRESMASIRLG